MEGAREGARVDVACRAGLVVLLLVVLALLARTLGDVNYGFESDDAVYLARGASIARDGLGALPRAFAEYASEPKLWTLPSPLRIGYSLVAAACFVAVEPSYLVLTWISLVAWLAAIVVQFAFARRRFGPVRGLLIAALFAFSCLGLGMARLALLDAFVTLWIVLAIWLYLDALDAPADRPGAAIAFVAAMAAAILTKESSALFLVPLVAFAVLDRVVRRLRGARDAGASWARVAVLACAPLATALVVWLLAAGGYANWWTTVTTVRRTLAENVYAFNHLAGPWYRYVVDFVLLSPWTTLLAAGYLGVLAVRAREGRLERVPAYLAVVTLVAVAEFGAIEKNVRYLLPLEAALRVFAVLFVWELAGAAARARGRVVAGAVVLVLCASEWSSFDLVFLRNRTYEPVSSSLLIIRQMIPTRFGYTTWKERPR